MFKDWNFWFSVLTALIAVTALAQTSKQTKLSNKQHLFEKRLNSFFKIDGLVKLYEENKGLIESKKSDVPLLATDLDFKWLTNNSYLENISEAIMNPLENPHHKDFLIKREELKMLASEVELIFRGKSASKVKLFVLSYEGLLFKLYKYHILINKMQKHSEQFGVTFDKAQKAVDEPMYREKLITAYIELQESYQDIKKFKAMDKLKAQIRL